MTLKKREVSSEMERTLFNFGTATIRVIPDFKDGQPYFVAKDVAEALGYGRDAAAPRKVISNIVANHCPNRIQITRKDVSYETQDTFGKAPSLSIIPESDLYRLVMRDINNILTN
ncbi:Bro-N domain-containing protein [Shewanella chilikensis]|uniref:BRO-N domain-containing protein n=1 Tax=Shewanella chilikensis TaxID=558541 RepID=UPI001CD20FC8|nr:Bro-N domain-containing protein [Shewanella chilikensis]MCA0949809.1 Bro-N domain-containing protein [Shewanella chilikensis]